MALASDAFYLPQLRPQLSQGDVYLAPSVVVWSTDTYAAPSLLSPAPGVGGTVLARAWTRSTTAPSFVPEITLATSWTPVLVLSHDCEIDKEFNEHVDALVREGVPEPEAEARTGARKDLDRYILVSPLLAYHPSVVAHEKWDAIRSVQKIGYFPLPPMPAYEGAEFLMHLSRATTVERGLLAPHYKAASLTDAARGLLRFKLAEVLSSRNHSVVSKLEAAIGHQIVDVRTLKTKRQEATVALVLDDGSEIQVGAKVDQEFPLQERTRPVDSA